MKKTKNRFKKRWWDRGTEDIDPDEIFLDSSNLPRFDTSQFEGRLEKPISRRVIFAVGIFFAMVVIAFASRLWYLEIKQGPTFAEKSELNRLRDTLVFANRGVIYDRNGVPLAWNVANPGDVDFSSRAYSTSTGLGNIIGYVKYPSKDSSGFYYREDYMGMDGVEKIFDDKLKGQNGLKITETDVGGNIKSQSVLNPPQDGEPVTLSIDSRIQSELYNVIEQTATTRGFSGGAGAIMDVTNGEIIAEATYPGYESQTFTDGTDSSRIKSYLNNKNNPLLDRASSGLYTPGSIVKPFMALGALNEGVITPDKVLYTTGSISIPNPYDPSQSTVFKDWQNQGPLDMRKAIQESSDVYFYEVGGGYQDQPGLGIANIEKYMNLFGFGQDVGSPFFGMQKGVIPSPEWKKVNFNGEQWYLGDTYHTAIGQYGFQVTPIQIVRAIGAVANYGTLLHPTILKGDTSMLSTAKHIDLPKQDFDVVHDGMRQSAEKGTAVALNVPYVEFAGKTGTAQLGVNKEFVNSWVTGFFPFQSPHYSFVLLMEHGPVTNLIGAPYTSLQLFNWMDINTPEYFTLK